MSSTLFDYLDVSGPEYGYLGHFRERQYLECGHNELGLQEQIAAGNIPDLHAAGRNMPAESEPGNISNQGSSAGTAPDMSHAGGAGAKAGHNAASSSVLGGKISGAIKDAFSPGQPLPENYGGWGPT